MDELEQFILHKLFIIGQSVDENLKNYNFHKLYKDLLNFCTLDLSSFYFDIRKDVLYCDKLKLDKKKKLCNCSQHNFRKPIKMVCPNFSFYY